MMLPARLMAVLALAALMLGACGPRYRTYTSYHPPTDQVGKQCVNSCLDRQTMCRREKDLEVKHCRFEAREVAADQTLELERMFRHDLRRYRHGALETPPEPPAAVEPNYASCNRTDSQLESRCGGDFDLCYQNCGGQITYATHCVANCED